MLSEFQIERYHIDKLCAEILNREGSFPIEFQYFASYQKDYREDQWKGSIHLGFRMVTDDEKKDLMYEVIITGDFNMPGVHDEDAEKIFLQRLQVNGAATLIPLARAALSTTFSLMGFPNKYTLPNINVMSIQWQPFKQDN